MRQLTLEVTEIATFAGQSHVRCVTDATPPAAPGQFYLAQTSLPDQPFLRQPLFPVQTSEREWELWFEPSHLYASLQPDDHVDVIGPLGRGFQLPARSASLLTCAPTPTRLLPLILETLARGGSVTWCAPEGASDWPVNILPPAVEVQRGPLTSELVAWAEVVALDVSDPIPYAEQVRSLCPPRSADFVQALVTPTLPCGTGACQVCWVETRRGKRLACIDGPVFDY